VSGGVVTRGKGGAVVMEVRGLGEAITALEQIDGDLHALSGPMLSAVKALALRIRLKINSQTYQLAATLTPLATALEAEVVSTSPYSGPQDWGWYGVDRLGRRHAIPPQHFSAEGLAAGWPAVYAILADAIESAIARAGAAA